MERKMPFQHPGVILRDQIINAYGLNVTEAAELLKVSRVALSAVLNGRADISPEMSLRISAVFGGNAQLWLDLQNKYTLAEIQPKIKTLKLKAYKPKKAATE